MRVGYIPPLFMVLLLCLSSCMAPRYATYKPAGDAGPQWKVKAEMTLGGEVTVTIDDKEVLKGQYPLFGEEEVRGSYQGRDVSMVLRTDRERGATTWECLVYAENNQIGQFKW